MFKKEATAKLGKKQSSIRKREDIRFYERMIDGDESSDYEKNHVR